MVILLAPWPPLLLTGACCQTKVPVAIHCAFHVLALAMSKNNNTWLILNMFPFLGCHFSRSWPPFPAVLSMSLRSRSSFSRITPRPMLMKGRNKIKTNPTIRSNKKWNRQKIGLTLRPTQMKITNYFEHFGLSGLLSCGISETGLS